MNWKNMTSKYKITFLFCRIQKVEIAPVIVRIPPSYTHTFTYTHRSQKTSIGREQEHHQVVGNTVSLSMILHNVLYQRMLVLFIYYCTGDHCIAFIIHFFFRNEVVWKKTPDFWAMKKNSLEKWIVAVSINNSRRNIAKSAKIQR